jgi:hypothetical protein
VKGNTAVRFSVAALIGLIASACASGGEGLTDQSGAGIDGPDGLSDVPSDLDWKDTSPGWSLGGQKLLLTGTIYVSPGVPAGDVILYYYQTNPQGRYLHDPTQPRSMAPNALGQTHGFIRRLALTFVPSLRDRASELVYNRLDPEVSNTILIYRESRIVEKAVDLPATPENFRWISTRLDQIQAKP